MQVLNPRVSPSYNKTYDYQNYLDFLELAGARSE